jgi:hypothetical protein
MKRHAAVNRKSPKELLQQLRVEITNHGRHCRKLRMKIRPAANVQADHGKGFIHGYESCAIPLNVLLAAKSRGKGFPQNDAHILSRMVPVNPQIPFCRYPQIQSAMHRKKGQHMVQKANAGFTVGISLAIQIDFHRYLGLIRFAV